MTFSVLFASSCLAILVASSEPVLRVDEGIAAGYQYVLEMHVVFALRGRRSHIGSEPTVSRRLARFRYGVLSPLSQLKSAEAIPTLFGSGLRRAWNTPISRLARRPAVVITPAGPSAERGQTAIRVIFGDYRCGSITML